MNFLLKKEISESNKFLKKGYIISKVEKRKSLNYLKNIITINSQKILKRKNLNLNKIHNYVSANSINEFRLEILNKLNKDSNSRFHYFNLARESLFNLTSNELMMQKNINLSIQLPNDESSLLPIHSDVWSGDSPYEINLWLPLVDCYKSKSMYLLKKKYLEKFILKLKKNKIKNSSKIFNLVKNEIQFLKINFGNFLIFDQTLPHGNVINKEKETRWSMNCRFKSMFSPYGDKKIGEFFLPITTRSMTKIGLKYKSPFIK